MVVSPEACALCRIAGGGARAGVAGMISAVRDVAGFQSLRQATVSVAVDLDNGAGDLLADVVCDDHGRDPGTRPAAALRIPCRRSGPLRLTGARLP